MNDEKTIHIAPPKRIEKWAVFALMMLSVFLAVEWIGGLRSLSVPTTPVDTISVTGMGQVSLAPDIAHIIFTVQQTAATAAAAQTAATKQTNAAIDYVKGQGIADKDITTLSYSVSPEYSYITCPPGTACPVYNQKITGYQVAETIQVTVRDLDKISGLLQGLGQQNVQNVSGPDFALESPTAGQDAARAKAIENAKSEAKILASQLGVSLVRIISFNESGGPYPMYAYGKGGGATADSLSVPTPNIPVGQNTYSSTVSITYEIR